MEDKILSSVWDGLNPNLIASFYEVDRDGKRVDIYGGNIGPFITVKAPLSDSSFEVTQNWQSPFENASQGFMPTIQQLLATGDASKLAQMVDSKIGTDLHSVVSKLEGRSSITKLNSTQIYAGAAGAKFNVTAEFRAWADPIKEVHEPFDQLMSWALPVELAKDGLLLEFLKSGDGGPNMLPSKSPTYIAVRYQGCTYYPLVIESISKATNSPIDKNGKYVSLSVPMQLSGLTAIDRKDWEKFNGR